MEEGRHVYRENLGKSGGVTCVFRVGKKGGGMCTERRGACTNGN